MIGATLYLVGREINTKELVKDANSCIMCRRLIINSGIERVIIRDTESDYRVIDVSEWIDEDDSMESNSGY